MERTDFQRWLESVSTTFLTLNDQQRNQSLDHIISLSGAAQLRHLSNGLETLLKRDFLRLLPLELAFYLLRWLDPQTLLCCCLVSKQWNKVNIAAIFLKMYEIESQIRTHLRWLLFTHLYTTFIVRHCIGTYLNMSQFFHWSHFVCAWGSTSKFVWRLQLIRIAPIQLNSVDNRKLIIYVKEISWRDATHRQTEIFVCLEVTEPPLRGYLKPQANNGGLVAWRLVFV